MRRGRRRSAPGRAAVALFASLALLGCSPATTVRPDGPTKTLPPPSGPPHPFHVLPCRPIVADVGAHVRFCSGFPISQSAPSGGIDRRVRSFDGTPLDADVTLPSSGNGPFPLLVMLHGLGEDKSAFEGADGRGTNAELAARGYAVLTYTARGFGKSCGLVAWRTPDCDKGGWIHLADQRYEIRDTQYLAGLLVDEGLVYPDIAVTGVSYGGGQSIELALLDNRVRLEDGQFAPWTSPRGVPMRVAATYAQWGWDDLINALAPNGAANVEASADSNTDDQPHGVDKESYVDLLARETEGGFLPPPGTDPTSDILSWHQDLGAGEPYVLSEFLPIDQQIQQYKSATGIPLPAGGPGAIMVQNGLTDPLFNGAQPLHLYNELVAAHDPSALYILLNDLGHGWSQDKSADFDTSKDQGETFLDDVMLRHVRPPLEGITMSTVTCPQNAAPGPTVHGASIGALGPRQVTFGAPAPQLVTSDGGDPAVAAALDPVGHPFCASPPMAAPTTPEPGTALATAAVGASPIFLAGAARIQATLTVNGIYPELVGRLWDVSGGGTRQIVAIDVFRLPAAQAEPAQNITSTVTFQLPPMAWRFPAGDTVELELVGSNAPFYRASNGTFTVGVSNLKVVLPVH